MSRDPRSMSYDEIVQEVQTLKHDMERATNRVVELSLTLYSRVRQTPSDDYSSRYLSFANTWTRLGQMVEASLHRTGGAFRLMETVRRDKQDVQEERPVRTPRKKAASQSPTTDLSELYGAEMVTNASR